MKIIENTSVQAFCSANGLSETDVLQWQKQYDSFQLHVFTTTFENEDILNEIWEPLNDDIAINFQTTLEKEIEAWNVYIIYIVKDKVSRGVKYKIEQDKFSCRKLVFDNFSNKTWNEYMNDKNKIASFIESRLFSINLGAPRVASDLSLADILDDEHSLMLKVINENIDRKNFKPVFDAFLKSI